jgi:feruloyl-CoA synthase
VLRSGGTLFIDAGKPAPGLFETSLRNLAHVSPTIYLNVPIGFSLLVDALEADPAAARAFFRRLRLIMYAAAALPMDTWNRLTALARRFAPRDVALTTSWGATETAPAATSAHFPLDGPGTIGVPLPGTEIKLAPVNDRFELRVRGPNVAPGYFSGPFEATEVDEDGFYRTGDAGRLANRTDPSQGVVFDGRIRENFKLANGTWVHTAAVRMTALQATAPLVWDLVIERAATSSASSPGPRPPAGRSATGSRRNCAAGCGRPSQQVPIPPPKPSGVCWC